MQLGQQRHAAFAADIVSGLSGQRRAGAQAGRDAAGDREKDSSSHVLLLGFGRMPWEAIRARSRWTQPVAKVCRRCCKPFKGLTNCCGPCCPQGVLRVTRGVDRGARLTNYQSANRGDHSVYGGIPWSSCVTPETRSWPITIMPSRRSRRAIACMAVSMRTGTTSRRARATAGRR